jgi:Domain of unknown function (DUF1844)
VLMSEAESHPLPPPTFTFLVLSLRAQTEIQLGLMRFEEDEEKPPPNLATARHSIDLLAMLFEKTKGNLSLEEQRLIENSLTELRFRFVQISDELSQAASQKA